ncbi:GTPase activating protein for Arf [Drechmeria coniospora]|uniref:GTPase activating protein for Arf n=1 Tax=Drechmeria coniospora TaxID=98403 RepID=A0A151GTM9_DRECN|nr:GTPase activating protein for Arf [Drechmeria coniospora]KYK60469.1 GTPase activating protein for Arf [Drechmeria coniospora]
MRKVGNIVSNQLYNSENKTPPIPIDADEADAAMERFIRSKYINDVAGQQSRPRGPTSDEGIPPPLPPKNSSSRFGFRSASSIFPLSSRAKKEAKMANMMAAEHAHASAPSKKPFGVTADNDLSNDHGENLVKLRDMGFVDNNRNDTVLKAVGGNLDRAVEALVRLGEGGSRSPTTPTVPLREKTLRTSRSLTPMSSPLNGLAVGLTVPQRSGPERPTTASTSTSTNPFDMMTMAQPQTAQSTGTLKNKNPYGSSVMATNPFGQPSPPVDVVGLSFQGLTIAQPQQTLFPHRTGDNGAQQQVAYQQQHMLPLASTIPAQVQHLSFQGSMTYPQPLPPTNQPAQMGQNPFFSQPSSPNQQQIQAMAQSLPAGAVPAQGAYAGNPFVRSPTRIGSPFLVQIPEQGQTTFLTTSPQPLPTNSNPFFANTAQFAPHQQLGQPALAQQQQLALQQLQGQPALVQQQQQQQQQQQFVPQPGFGQPSYGESQVQYQPQRQDKASIMALYNQPTRPVPQPTRSEPILKNQQMYAQPAPSVPSSMQDPRLPPQPAVGSTNPFAMTGPTSGPRDPFTPSRHMSRESMNLGMDMAWANGRHSPDAFASLSARHA